MEVHHASDNDNCERIIRIAVFIEAHILLVDEENVKAILRYQGAPTSNPSGSFEPNGDLLEEFDLHVRAFLVEPVILC
jgi:hypothetical protein